MKITGCDFLPIEGGWDLDDKAAIESDAVSDYYLLKGKPKTKGFRSVREPGSGTEPTEFKNPVNINRLIRAVTWHVAEPEGAAPLRHPATGWHGGS